MKKEIIVANNIDNIYDEINALIREKKTDVKKVVNDALSHLTGELEKDLVRSSPEIISLSMEKKLLQKSVNVWNRSMVLDLIKHQFRE